MARDFNLDTNAAMDASSGGKRIKDPGVYTGRIINAWYEVNSNGTESVQILFQSDSGQEVGPLPLYTHKSNGEVLSGFNVFNAILACSKLKAVKAKNGSVQLYDYDTKTTATKQKEVYPELSGKPIGLVLRAEEYENRDKEVKERLVIVAPFDPQTKLTADEILKKELTPRSLERISAWVQKEPVKRLKKKPADAYQALQQTSGFDDDDIPF